MSEGRAQRRPARVGIVAGSGPEAGIDLWTKVLHENRQALGDAFGGDVDAPNVTIFSVPELGLSMDLPDTAETVWAHLREACERISEHVDAFAIACNTLYFFADEIENLGLPATLVSPVDSLRSEAEHRPNEALALLGAAPVTDFVGTTSPYARLAGVVDIELPPDPLRLHRLIEGIKINGGSSPELETEFGRITSQLAANVGVLACTELPLVRPHRVDMELIDINRLLARDLLAAAVRLGRDA